METNGSHASLRKTPLIMEKGVLYIMPNLIRLESSPRGNKLKGGGADHWERSASTYKVTNKTERELKPTSSLALRGCKAKTGRLQQEEEISNKGGGKRER